MIYKRILPTGNGPYPKHKCIIAHQRVKYGSKIVLKAGIEEKIINPVTWYFPVCHFMMLPGITIELITALQFLKITSSFFVLG